MKLKRIAFSTRDLIKLSNGKMNTIYDAIEPLSKSAGHHFIYHDDAVWAAVSAKRVKSAGNDYQTVFGGPCKRIGNKFFTPVVIGSGKGSYLKCPLAPVGTIVAVAEPWARCNPRDRQSAILYKIDAVCPPDGMRWKSAWTMPMEAARLFLRIVSIDVQLHEYITKDWCWSLGVERVPDPRKEPIK